VRFKDEDDEMKICYLGSSDSVHIKVFIDYFTSMGHEVHTFGRNPMNTGENHHHHDLNLRRRLLGTSPRTTMRKKRTGPVVGRKNGLSWWNRWFRRLLLAVDVISLRKMVKKIGPDIIHGHEVAQWGKPSVSLGPYPTVLSVWGSDVFRFPWKSRSIYRKVKYALDNADLIHLANENTRDFVIERFSVDPGKIRVIPWGIDLETFRPGDGNLPPDINRKLKVKDEDIIVLYPKGFRDHEKQNYIRLLRAFGEVAEEIENIKLVMLSYGRISGMKELERIIKESSLEGRVHIVKDFLTPEDMADLYRRSDLTYIVPDTDELSQAILEAMACGSIPVLSDIRAYKHLFREEKNCLYVNQKDVSSIRESIEIYINRRYELAREMKGRNMKLILSRYDRKKQMPKIMSMYEVLLSRSR